MRACNLNMCYLFVMNKLLVFMVAPWFLSIGKHEELRTNRSGLAVNWLGCLKASRPLSKCGLPPTYPPYFVTYLVTNDNPVDGMGCYTEICSCQRIPPGFFVTLFYFFTPKRQISPKQGFCCIFGNIQGVSY